MAPPSRLWKPTRTGGLLSSAFCGAAVVVAPPPPAAAAVVAVPAAAAVVVAPAVDAVVVSELLLLLLSPPHAATPISAPAARTADSTLVVLIVSPSGRARSLCFAPFRVIMSASVSREGITTGRRQTIDTDDDAAACG